MHFDYPEVPFLGGVGPVCLGWFKRLVNGVRKLAHEASGFQHPQQDSPRLVLTLTVHQAGCESVR